MKRDMDLIRELLFKIEGSETRYVRGKLAVSGYSDEVVLYNLDLLISAGLVNGKMIWYQGGGGDSVVEGLTWEGHDFLDTIRTDSVWEKTKSYIKDQGLQSVPIELLKKAAVAVMEQNLGI